MSINEELLAQINKKVKVEITVKKIMGNWDEYHSNLVITMSNGDELRWRYNDAEYANNGEPDYNYLEINGVQYQMPSDEGTDNDYLEDIKLVYNDHLAQWNC